MYMPVVEAEKCTQCMACARICPKMVLDETKKGVEVSMPTYCTGCESCCAVCPHEAIKVKEV